MCTQKTTGINVQNLIGSGNAGHLQEEGLGFFKSKSRKEVEDQFPVLQNTVANLTTQNKSLTSNVQALQNSLVQKDQMIRKLESQSGSDVVPTNQWKNPIVIGSLIVGVVGGAYGVYKAFN